MKVSVLSSEELPQKFPQVSFGLDQELDIWKITNFLLRSDLRGGNNFKEIILRDHSALKGVDISPAKERDAKVKEYVDRIYRENGECFEKLVPLANDDWNRYAPKFFKVADSIFKGTPWPLGEYKGFLTISSPCPRFLDSKTFQIPVNPRYIWLKVAAHELLHFIFYEYVRRRYVPQLPNTVEGEMNELLADKFIIPLWELSEVFDVALLIEERFGEGGKHSPRAYPALGGYLKEFDNLWKEAGEDIDLFFSKLEK